MPKDDAETAALKTELNEIIEKCKEEQKKLVDCNLAEKCGDMGGAPKCQLTTKKTLKGHINKVNSVHFAGDSRFVFF
jgi:guanine nucleotide-binding protein subunit beta, other